LVRGDFTSLIGKVAYAEFGVTDVPRIAVL
jgi:hypothetical protein